VTCTALELAGGGVAIACTRGQRARRCSACRANPAAVLCDGPGRRAGTTCDRALCFRCAVAIGDQRDLCPEHAGAWARRALLALTVVDAAPPAANLVVRDLREASANSTDAPSAALQLIAGGRT
jgi:hypothetical protein